MSILHTAQVLTEMLNDSEYKKAVASKSARAFHGWDLSAKERALLVSEARARKARFSPSESKALNYVIRNQPLTEPVGVALANAIARHLGLPVDGPISAGCDGGCCGWTGRIIFGADPAPRG